MSDTTDRTEIPTGTEGEPFGGAPPREAGTPQPGDPRIESALTQLRVIAAALAVSVMVYAGLAWYLVTGPGGQGFEAPGLPGVLVGVLAAFAIFDLLVAPVIERSLTGGVGTGTGSRDLEEAIAGYRRAKVIGFAFREAAAVLGLLIALFTGQAAWCYALTAATLVAMALAWPSREGLVRAARGSVQPR